MLCGRRSFSIPAFFRRDKQTLTGPSFDLEKLKAKICELRTDVEENPEYFPEIHVYDGEDIESFKEAEFKPSGSSYLGMPKGWLLHNSEKSFKHSCQVLATRYNVKPELVEAAIWLMNVYYMDGESYENGIDIDSFDTVQELYGIRDVETFSFMNQVYGRITHKGIAILAMLLDA